ncbi:MAG: SGNH/GDSL hydrolase family protein [Myxococcota bacterium]
MRRALYWLLAFVTSFLLTAGGIEAFMKQSGAVPPLTSYFHPELGLYSRPNVKLLKFKEGFFIGESYSGSRYGEDYPKSKPRGAYRIALIGDSFVEGLDVFSRHHFRAFMERDLRAHFDPDVQVLNFGRGNSTLRTSYHYLLSHVLEYEPDLVLFFLEERDRDPTFWPGRTQFVLEDGDLVLDYGWRESRNYKLFHWLDAQPVLNHYIELSSLGLLNRATTNIRNRSPGRIFLGKFHAWLFPRRVGEPDLPPDAEEVSELSRRILEELVALGDEGRAEVVFVLRALTPIPALKRALGEIGADTIDLGGLWADETGLLKSSGIHSRYWKATRVTRGHWNHEGHREVGRALADALIERLGGTIDSRRQPSS